MLYFSLLQLHDVHFVHPMVGAEVPGGVGAGGKPGGELAYYTTTLPHHHHPQVCPLTQTFYSSFVNFWVKKIIDCLEDKIFTITIPLY